MADSTFSYQHLRDFTLAIFHNMGCSSDHATLATDVLLNADLRGIDSHGIARLSGYVRLWEAKRVNATPNISGSTSCYGNRD
jgi:L-2-hydroxycarboxylate dehydrogenase (NAD+)